MTETTTPADDAPEPDVNACTRVMVGHAISVLDDEASVCIDISGRSARLSVAGARIVASQIVAWADHAESHNKARPASTMMKLMYRVIEKAGEPDKENKMEWRSLDPESAATDNKIQASMDALRKVAATAPLEEIHIPLRRVKHKPRILRSISKKRKAKRK